MNEAERIARGHRAHAAMDEFLGPACDALRAEYMAALTKIAAGKPWKTAMITKLAIAQRVIDAVEAQLRTAILDGGMAVQEKNRAERIAALPEARRRWL